MPFGDLGFAEVVVLLLLALFVVGPDRLPEVAAKTGRVIRQVRGLAEDWSSQLKQELPEVGDLDLDLRSLNPRTIATDALFGTGSPGAAKGPAAASASSLAAVLPVSSGPPLQPWERAPFDPDAT